MLIATAIDCLDECTFNYVLHEKTKIFTALGEIVVVEATNTGLALVAGPSRKSEMIKLVKTLKKYNPINIFIDGALFRKSIAGTTVSDAMILSTGASYNEDINIVVKDTKTLVDQLNLPIFKGRFYDLLLGIKFNALINTRKSMFRLGSLWDDNNKDVIKEEINEEIRYLYLKGALTDTVIHQLVDIRHKIKKLTIILKDPTHIICDYGNFALLKKMNVDVKVLNQIELLFISYNPHSPIYEDFNDQQFYKLLEENIDVECINVLKDTE